MSTFTLPFQLSLKRQRRNLREQWYSFAVAFGVALFGFQSRGLVPRYIWLAAKYVNGRYLPTFDRFSPPMAAKTDRREREVMVMSLAANLKLRGASPRDLFKPDIYR